MSNSSLVSYTRLSPNHSGTRTHSIDRISPHCVVGQCSVETLGSIFSNIAKQASCQYGIGPDGRVGMYVEEKNRSWCTSSNANDQRAVTIECASDTTHPYAMKDAVYETLINLCTDICRRNGKTKLIWISDKETALNYTPASNEMQLTVHRWFANKSCPGDWLFSRLGDVASRVTANLNGESTDTPTTTTYPSVPFLVKVLVSDLYYRSEPSMNGTVKGKTGKGTFTIVEVKDDWGRLKSGVGWIYLGNSSDCTIAGSTKTTTKSIDELAREVIQGKWGNGQDRKKRLTAAGYDYYAVQNRVNQMLG